MYDTESDFMPIDDKFMVEQCTIKKVSPRSEIDQMAMHISITNDDKEIVREVLDANMNPSNVMEISNMPMLGGGEIENHNSLAYITGGWDTARYHVTVIFSCNDMHGERLITKLEAFGDGDNLFTKSLGGSVNYNIDAKLEIDKITTYVYGDGGLIPLSTDILNKGGVGKGDSESYLLGGTNLISVNNDMLLDGVEYNNVGQRVSGGFKSTKLSNTNPQALIGGIVSAMAAASAVTTNNTKLTMSRAKSIVADESIIIHPVLIKLSEFYIDNALKSISQNIMSLDFVLHHAGGNDDRFHLVEDTDIVIDANDFNTGTGVELMSQNSRKYENTKGREVSEAMARIMYKYDITTVAIQFNIVPSHRGPIPETSFVNIIDFAIKGLSPVYRKNRVNEFLDELNQDFARIFRGKRSLTMDVKVYLMVECRVIIGVEGNKKFASSHPLLAQKSTTSYINQSEDFANNAGVIGDLRDSLKLDVARSLSNGMSTEHLADWENMDMSNYKKSDSGLYTPFTVDMDFNSEPNVTNENVPTGIQTGDTPDTLFM